MVGVTGLEPATSRPPAVRATNCATPRCDYLVKSNVDLHRSSEFTHILFDYSLNPSTFTKSYVYFSV